MNSSAQPCPATPESAAYVAEMRWLRHVIYIRIKHYFQTAKTEEADEFEQAPPTFPPLPAVPGDSRYAALLVQAKVAIDERLLLALALAPHLAPGLLDEFFLKNKDTDRGYAQFGGVKGVHHAGFLPTGETALFLLAGGNLAERLRCTRLLDPEQPLFARRVLRLAPPAEGEPAWSGALSSSPALLRHLITGEEAGPEAGAAFPAARISTELTDKDQILDHATEQELETLEAWVKHGPYLREKLGLGRHIKPGFRALFYGPPGTGKTLAAGILGRKLHREVYRVDLSQVVSKYIGETEKNLAVVFAEASRRDWILFFDEADALFGRRTATESAHDRYANQEVSYLLQRIAADVDLDDEFAYFEGHGLAALEVAVGEREGLDEDLVLGGVKVREGPLDGPGPVKRPLAENVVAFFPGVGVEELQREHAGFHGFGETALKGGLAPVEQSGTLRHIAALEDEVGVFRDGGEAVLVGVDAALGDDLGLHADGQAGGILEGRVVPALARRGEADREIKPREGIVHLGVARSRLRVLDRDAFVGDLDGLNGDLVAVGLERG